MAYLTRSFIEQWEQDCRYDERVSASVLGFAFSWHEGESKMVIEDDIDNQFLFSAWDPVERVGDYEVDQENYIQWLMEKYSSYCSVLEQSLRRKHGQIADISKEIESNIF